MMCEQCGSPTRTSILQERGEFKGQLWCPSCHHKRQFEGVNLDHTHFRRDEYPGGITLENYGANPVTFYSESDRLAYMKRNGLEHNERYVPFPGTDKDPAGVMNPNGYVDDVTMRNRNELFLRAHNSGAPKDESAKAAGASFSGELSPHDAVAIATNTKPTRQSRVGRRLKEQDDAQ